jgi:ATP-dependent protease ClpP protease subunit
MFWGEENKGSAINSSYKKRKYIDSIENKGLPNKYEMYNAMIVANGDEIRFTTGVNEISIEILIREITKIINKHTKDPDDLPYTISYIIDSPGGCIKSLLKFVDFIKLTKMKYPNITFVSIATGQIASAATVMCIVADKRIITEHASAMIHELSSGNNGCMTHINSHTKFLNKLHHMLSDIYVSRTNKSRKYIDHLLLKETWFSAQEYLAAGFVDEIK